MSKDDMKLIEMISNILAREKQISSEEHLRMMNLIRKEKQDR